MNTKLFASRITDPLSHQVSVEDLTDFEAFLDRITDIPSSSPSHSLMINRVGISDREILVHVQDFLNPSRVVPVPCSAEVYVDLAPTQRGIHMSRIEEAIRDVNQGVFPTLDEYGAQLAREVAHRQGAERGFVHLRGNVLLERPTPKSGKVSSDRFCLLYEGHWRRSDEMAERIGLQGYNIAACPCTRAYSKYSNVESLSSHFSLEQVNLILDRILTFTHCQRGTVTVIVGKRGGLPSYGDLYGVLERSTHLVYELLKRPDEHELVRRAHERPQFTEDVVRDVCAELLATLGDLLPRDTYLRVESKLLESIHIHSVQTVIEGEAGHLLDQLRGLDLV